MKVDWITFHQSINVLVFLEEYYVVIWNSISPLLWISLVTYVLKVVEFVLPQLEWGVVQLLRFHICFSNNDRYRSMYIVKSSSRDRNRFLLKNYISNLIFPPKLNILKKYCNSHFKN